KLESYWESVPPDSSVSSTVRIRFGLFKLNNTPLEGEPLNNYEHPTIFSNDQFAKQEGSTVPDSAKCKKRGYIGATP
ncbi:2109_t:CDS:2, partial [Gigaspora margarita]